jgi:8-oxo-dGTP pyrophosphatase MutT (NUDIX family)
VIFIPNDTIAAWEQRYGSPRVWDQIQPITERDYGIIKASQKHGRHHDITLYIERTGVIAVIAKPFYPQGLYRAPSGGLEPGESLENGARREAMEETGLPIELGRYLLRTNVIFRSSTLGDIDWHSHIFSATTSQSRIAHTDHDEIREARWAQPSEFATFGTIMRASEYGGLHYRAALHEQVADMLDVFGSGNRS